MRCSCAVCRMDCPLACNRLDATTCLMLPSPVPESLLQKWRQSLYHVAPDGKRTVRGMADFCLASCGIALERLARLQPC